jgi:hypothetical protein
LSDFKQVQSRYILGDDPIAIKFEGRAQARPGTSNAENWEKRIFRILLFASFLI